MVILQYLHRGKWVDCGEFYSDHLAWISLGGDDFNYRTIDRESGEVIVSKSSNL